MDKPTRQAIIAAGAGVPLKDKVRFYCSLLSPNFPVDELADEEENVISDLIVHYTRTAVLEWGDEQPVWYHGGAAGLQVGDILTPSAGRGYGALACSMPPGHALNKVYITRQWICAHFYARSLTQGGTVYQVEPLGRIIVDPPDLRAMQLLLEDPEVGHTRPKVPYDAFCCPQARITRIVETIPAPCAPMGQPPDAEECA